MSTAAIKDPEWLREQYVDRGMSVAEIAQVVGCASPSVLSAMRRYGIQARPAAPRTSCEIGERYGRLVVIAESAPIKSRRAVRCRCDCGAERVILLKNLKRECGTLSCGCLKRESAVERFTTHGASATPLYRAWQKLCERNEICEAWRDFDVFAAAVGARPPGKVLARFRLDRKFGPSNYWWATLSQVATNRERGRAQVVSAAARLGRFAASDIARDTGRNLSTAYRHLAALRENGSVALIEESAGGRGAIWEYVPPDASAPTAERATKIRNFSGAGTSGGTDLPADKDMRRLAQQAIAAGARVQRSGSDHFRASFNGKTVTLSNTPSDRRAVVNARADLKRIGLAV